MSHSAVAPTKGTKVNGFFLFMKERRRTLQEQGVDFEGGWKDAAKFLDDEWQKLKESKREHYRKRATEMNATTEEEEVKPVSKSFATSHYDDGRKTTLGVPFYSLSDEKEAEAFRYAKHQRDLRQMLERSDPKEATFIIVHFSLYCHLRRRTYIPAEIALTAFNVQDGIKDNFCTLIDPYEIPSGLGFEARKAGKILGIPYPPFDNRCQGYSNIVTIIENFITKHEHPKVKGFKLFCLPNEMDEVRGGLAWLYRQTHKENKIELYSFAEGMRVLSAIGVANRCEKKGLSVFEVAADLIEQRKKFLASQPTFKTETSGYPLATLKESGDRHLISRPSASTSHWSTRTAAWKKIDWERMLAGIFTTDGQVEDFLNSLQFAFDGELGCLYHLDVDHAFQLCALNVTNRYAYNMLDVLVNTFEVMPKLHFHLPDLRDRGKRELQRRKELLNVWGLHISSQEDLLYKPPKKSPLLYIESPYGPTRAPDSGDTSLANSNKESKGGFSDYSD